MPYSAYAPRDTTFGMSEHCGVLTWGRGASAACLGGISGCRFRVAGVRWRVAFAGWGVGRGL